MILKPLNDIEKPYFRDKIGALLAECDSEFIPPLSSRSSTTQSNLSQNEGGDGISAYLDALMEQEIICALDNDSLLAFVSYRKDYVCPEIDESLTPNIYLSTLIVAPDARGGGITRKIYSYLFEKYSDRRVFTRTWSPNFVHIKILEGFGFSEHHRIKDHRGEGIDTVYFRLR